MWAPATCEKYSRKAARYQSVVTDNEWRVIANFGWMDVSQAGRSFHIPPKRGRMPSKSSWRRSSPFDARRAETPSPAYRVRIALIPQRGSGFDVPVLAEYRGRGGGPLKRILPFAPEGFRLPYGLFYQLSSGCFKSSWVTEGSHGIRQV